MEPLTTPNPEKYSKAVGLSFKASNANGKIWIFVEEGADFEVKNDSDQVLHGRFMCPRLPCPILVSAMYAKCSRGERIPLWDKMREISTTAEGMPWSIGVDFNTILSIRDRSGSDTNRQAEMIDFSEAIEDCRLLDPGCDGSDYTWAKNGLFERLDRVLLSESWTRIFESARVTNLPRVASDHGPVLVRPTEAEGLLNLQIKLARVKKALKSWNKEVFGNIHSNIRDMDGRIVSAQADFEERPTPENRTEINKSIAEYICLLRMEEDFWRQKATLRWLAEGDKNTRFYQSWVK
ncbi:uncharacterized protein LOC121774379 [Salvia splendens]|uniref:uncharacterized protein LOC121774379 n=1 Tax=Salvia splendens TaxID=180675 RepID=UPI001C2628B3|nr:uncharacterized protein LOC121774379 [Salvia splendens]